MESAIANPTMSGLIAYGERRFEERKAEIVDQLDRLNCPRPGRTKPFAVLVMSGASLSRGDLRGSIAWA